MQFIEIEPVAAASTPMAAQVSAGIPIPPVRVLQVMSADEWEAFTEEWLFHHKAQGTYKAIKRYSGPGDLGLDVVGFSTSSGFADSWDSFQCKHYDHALTPTDVYGEIAKVIYHSFKKTPPYNQTCRIPCKHVFVAPRGVGITLGRLLKDPERFKQEVREKWESHCLPKLGINVTDILEGELLKYFNQFDFSIFDDRTCAELIEEHANTVFYTPRFGGGLPPRTNSITPPNVPAEQESVYLLKMMDAYSEYLGKKIDARSDLSAHKNLEIHYDRQRVLFYSAESLRNFARDRTPSKTFDGLQDDIYYGVVDTCESEYKNKFERLRQTVSKAATVDVSGNALVSVTNVSDKQGVCHQLANDGRLTWSTEDE